jgi:hypothetical protein
MPKKPLRRTPRNPRDHLLLADVAGETAESAGKLRQFTLGRKFKKEIDTTLSLDPRNIDALRYLMMFHLESPGFFGGDKTRGRAIPDQIMRILAVEGYFAQAQLARRDGHNDRVEGLYRKAVEAHPSSYPALSNGGLSRLQQEIRGGRKALP